MNINTYKSLLTRYGSKKILKQKLLNDSAVFLVKLDGVNFYGVFTFIYDSEVPYDVYTRFVGFSKIEKMIMKQLRNKFKEQKNFIMEKKYE